MWMNAARKAIRLEAEAIRALENRIGPSFEAAVNLILAQGQRGGKVVFTGIGKSADIARKTVATLNSTGTAAAFLHAADALHGDLGLVSEGDVVIAVSKSGATAELIALIPMLKARDLTLVAMVGRVESPVGEAAQIVLDISVEQEACPHDLAPTTSSAAQLAMGDAMAMALMDARGFTSDDFARSHPGGSLGRKLLLRLGHLLSEGGMEPETVAEDAPLRDVVLAVSAGRVGAVAVSDRDDAKAVVGIITDGDLRRALERDSTDWTSLTARDVMNTAPRSLSSETRAIDALDMLEAHRISQVMVRNAEGHFLGFVHLHHLMDAGIR
ncbi:MAG: KpsF/GutQ family sugar-phosphate isomerase [Flavobacteriales bacterium]|nr:KpsF/GutQ family sugar-phosphate isomerase [Flavobacteriales bacterium]